MALLAAWRRGAASCSGKVLPFQARFQNPAAAFDQFLGEELNYVDPSDEADATPGTQALRTDTFVREVGSHQVICATYTNCTTCQGYTLGSYKPSLVFGSLQVSEVFLIMHVQAFHVLDYPERLRKLLVSIICCCLVALFQLTLCLHMLADYMQHAVLAFPCYGW